MQSGINKMKMFLLFTFVGVINVDNVNMKFFFIVYICRYRKCRQCYENLCNIRSKVASRGGTPGKLGQLLREIQILMASMD